MKKDDTGLYLIFIILSFGIGIATSTAAGLICFAIIALVFEALKYFNNDYKN